MKIAILIALLVCLCCVTSFHSGVQARSPTRIRALNQICKSEGDPHIIDFRNRYYDMYGKGDYVLAETKDNSFVAHARTSRWGAVSVNSAIAVKLNDRTVEYNVESDKFYVDGEAVSVKVGKVHNFGKGASFKRVSQRSMIITLNNIHLTATWWRHQSWKRSMGSFGHISLVIDAPKSVNFTRGLCVSKSFIRKSARGILHNHVKRTIKRCVKPKKATRKAIKKAAKTCLKAGIRSSIHPLAFRACISDQIQTGRKIGKKIAKVISKLEKIHDKKSKKWNRVVRRAVIKRAASVPIKKRTVKTIQRMVRRALKLKRKLGRKFSPKKYLPKRVVKLIRKLHLGGKCPSIKKNKTTTLSKRMIKQLISVSKCQK